LQGVRLRCVARVRNNIEEQGRWGTRFGNKKRGPRQPSLGPSDAVRGGPSTGPDDAIKARPSPGPTDAVVDGVEAELVVEPAHELDGFGEVAGDRQRQAVGVTGGPALPQSATNARRPVTPRTGLATTSARPGPRPSGLTRLPGGPPTPPSRWWRRRPSRRRRG
jgi:hypothetical protein